MLSYTCSTSHIKRHHRSRVISTELPTDYHHISIIKLSVRWCVWKVGEGFPDRVLPKTLKRVHIAVYPSVTFHTNGLHIDRSALCLYTVTGGVSCPVSAAWHSCVAAHWSKYHCYKQAPS